MPGPQAAASDDVPVSVRFMNDSKEPVELLWHREMEGGLVVAQHLSEILPGRSRIIRSFSGHSFSMWQNDKEIQHWTMGPMKRQLYKLSSASRVLGMQPAVPSTASNSTPNAKTGATKQPDHRLADARQLAAQGKYREALELFRSVGDICPIERPKLAARVAHLERIVASEDMLKGRTVSTEVLKQSSTTSPKPRCDKCTLPLPCGKVHPAKRTYAEVRDSSFCHPCSAYALTWVMFCAAGGRVKTQRFARYQSTKCASAPAPRAPAAVEKYSDWGQNDATCECGSRSCTNC